MAESESTEMYLKTILELEDEDHEPVAISRIAERLGVSSVSATEMIKRLGERGLVVHTPYKGVEFTEMGRRRGLNVLRRHRLWEVFLVQNLGVTWEKSHDLACQLEHATADEVTERLADYLGHPPRCPHGSIIPPVEGPVDEPPSRPLSEMDVGEGGVIQRIWREETPLLDYLAERDIKPGRSVSVEDIAPYNGPLAIVIDGGEPVVLGREIAARVLVEV